LCLCQTPSALTLGSRADGRVFSFAPPLSVHGHGQPRLLARLSSRPQPFPSGRIKTTVGRRSKNSAGRRRKRHPNLTGWRSLLAMAKAMTPWKRGVSDPAWKEPRGEEVRSCRPGQ
jgi:hypothetical protein